MASRQITRKEAEYLVDTRSYSIYDQNDKELTREEKIKSLIEGTTVDIPNRPANFINLDFVTLRTNKLSKDVAVSEVDEPKKRKPKKRPKPPKIKNQEPGNRKLKL